MKNSAPSPSPEFSRKNTPSSFAFSSCSDDNVLNLSMSKNLRSKSMSNIAPDKYSPGEIRRIKERLLRTNSRLETSTFKSFTRKQKLTLTSLALVDFVSFCSMSIMAPFFPKEAAEKGLSDTLSGLIFSFYALVMFVTSPIFGKILPRFGAKFLFLAGMFMAGGCNLLFGTLEYVSNYTLFTALCIVIRGFEALGASAFSTASYVFVVNTFPQNIGSVLGILETFVGLGMSTGPAIGGITMILFVPFSVWLLPVLPDECNVSNRPPSIFRLIKVPTVFITGLVVIVVSSSWAFLDPTLEPHLRQFNLTPEKIGLIFLLFSGLYGVFSPIWGWLADKINNHWSMMVVGLFMCSIGLLLLGPCPYLPFIKSTLWLNLVALSILGISVALALLPTFQGLLTSALNSGCGDSLSTYSVVAGIWSCVYSLGEVIGPSLGGFLLEQYGFPVASTVMALLTLTIGALTLVFFLCKNGYCYEQEIMSDSGISESWRSTNSNSDDSESTPLLFTATDTNYKMYTEEKVQYYEQSRKHDNEIGDVDNNQVTDVRGTVSITAKGACEV